MKRSRWRQKKKHKKRRIAGSKQGATDPKDGDRGLPPTLYSRAGRLSLTRDNRELTFSEDGKGKKKKDRCGTDEEMKDSSGKWDG